MLTVAGSRLFTAQAKACGYEDGAQGAPYVAFCLLLTASPASGSAAMGR